MRILGIDPGLATIGYGIVDEDAGALRLVSYGIVTTPAGMPLPSRLQAIFADVQTLIASYHPDAVAVEELFFRRNDDRADRRHARGAVLVAAMSALMPDVLRIYADAVKQAVRIRRSRQAVQHMARAAGYGPRTASRRSPTLAVAMPRQWPSSGRQYDSVGDRGVRICGRSPART